MAKTQGTPEEENQKLYWKGESWFFKLLRFLNLLEPGRTVLSLSKLMIWLMLAIMLTILIIDPSNIVAVIGAATGASATLLNYAYRRYINYRQDRLSMETPPLDRDM